MGVIAEPEPIARPTGITVDAVLGRLAWLPQAFLGLLPRTIHRGLGWLLGRQTDGARGIAVFGRSVAGLGLGFVGTLILFNLVLGLLAVWARIVPGLIQALADSGIITSDSGWLSLAPASAIVQAGYAFAIMYLTGLAVRAPYDSFGRPFRALRGILWLREVIARIAGLLCLMGLGLLPLASLLMFLPLVMPQEAVLKDTLRPAQTRLARGGRRALAVLTGVVVLLALLTFGIQVVSWGGSWFRSDVYANLARQLLPEIVLARLPVALVEGWPFVLLVMYATDFALLLLIGKVPVQYNLRNLRVRWLTTLMTGVAFTVVVFLLVLMMSFVDSVNRLTASTGVHGNVFVLSEGSTDELFSNLAYGDVNKLELEKAVTDPQGRPLAVPIAVKALPGKGGQPPTRLISKETYFVINQEIAQPGAGPTRRFVQLRGVEDAEVAGKVHDISLLKGEWFGHEGAVEMGKGQSVVPCVLGEGASAAFGADYGKEKLDVGDTFKLGNLNMVVVGVMRVVGYKRWQILVSFMLESLTIALLGGLIGVLLVLLLNGIASALWDGLTITSTVTAGQGGGKSVVTKLVFGGDVVASGILFTIVMGRLGGLLPSVGAMRLGILESLR
jgi:hypothetical protein